VNFVQTQTRRLLLHDCMACNRIVGQPMCDLCADLEDADENAERRDDDD
jgi:hypothetical protein